jgi:hypothetical protein
MGASERVRDAHAEVAARVEAYGVQLRTDEIELLVAARATLDAWHALLELTDDRSVEPAIAFQACPAPDDE